MRPQKDRCKAVPPWREGTPYIISVQCDKGADFPLRWATSPPNEIQSPSARDHPQVCSESLTGVLHEFGGGECIRSGASSGP